VSEAAIVRHRRRVIPGFGITLGTTLLWLCLIVLIPLAALFLKTTELSPARFVAIITSARVLHALGLSFGLSLIAAAVNLVFGLLVVWALVRYEFPGRRIFDAIVDIPFALPTAVAGIALTNLYAETGWLGRVLTPLGIQVAFTPLGIFVALVFIGLPFVVRTVQPVLEDLEREMEEAAASLGADRWTIVRRVVLPSGRRSNLKAVLAKQAVKTQYPLEVRAAPGRKARIANMVVRACRVTLDLRDKRTSRRSTLEVNVVQAVERGTTPRGEKPIKWTLFTNRPIETIKDLTDVIKGYSMRWRIEEFHRTWKSGACCVEENQLRSTSAAIKWATILAAVAVRIERIKQLSREKPNLPAADEFSPAEIKAAALLYFGKAAKTKIAPAASPTIAQVTLWIACLGGYTGKTSSGGPPGSIVLARGMESVRAAAQALEALPSD